MIQRIQTFYLLIVALLAGVLPFFLNLWVETDNGAFFAENDIVISIAFYAIAVLAIVSIFLFKKRQNQFVVNRLNVILNLFLL